MRTIAVVARKGGSGKTTLAVHLALASYLSGRSTTLVDTDPQRSALEVFRMRADKGPLCVAAPSRGLLSLQRDASASGGEVMVIDTPAGTEEGMSTALVLSDLALLVIRPTFLDLAAAAQTADVLKRLRKPAIAVLNQAPVARDGQEPPAVRKAKEALRIMRLAVAPVILRARASYQTSLECGRSAVEGPAQQGGARELTELWAYIEQFALPQPVAIGRRLLAAE